MRVSAVVLLELLFILNVDAQHTAPFPKTPALQLDGTKAGVDAGGRLWLWNETSRIVREVSDEGLEIRRVSVPAATNVDADQERGVALLGTGGRKLSIIDWYGSVSRTILLPEPASDVAWLQGALIAVTPQLADHRVALWDTKTGALVLTMGDVPRLSRDSGQHLARATHVRYNVWRDEIVTLDGTFGNLYVYDSHGTELRHGRVSESPLPIHRWLSSSEGNDGDSRRLIVLWRYPTMSTSRDGSVWIGADGESSTPATLLELTVDGQVRSISITGPSCMRARPVVWDTRLIMLGNPESTRPSCAAAVDYATARDSEEVSAVQVGSIITAPAHKASTPWRLQSNATCPIINNWEKPSPCSCDNVTCPPEEGYTVGYACAEWDGFCHYRCIYRNENCP